MITELLLLRHGKTRGNFEHRYIGRRTDESLDPAGRAELNAPSGFHPEMVFTSPMKRCLETAELLFPGCDLLTIPEFTEIDFGQFEYHTYQDLSGRADYQAWIDSGGCLPFPGGESLEQYQRRVRTGFARMCRIIADSKAEVSGSADEQTTRIAAVVHGGTIMAILCAFAVPKKDYFSWQTANGCGYLVRFHCIGPDPEKRGDRDAFLPKSIVVQKEIV